MKAIWKNVEIDGDIVRDALADAYVAGALGKLGETMNDELSEKVREFFTILDTVEKSDMSGKDFHPTTINSCRAMDADRLNKLMPEMKRLAHKV